MMITYRRTDWLLQVLRFEDHSLRVRLMGPERREEVRIGARACANWLQESPEKVKSKLRSRLRPLFKTTGGENRGNQGSFGSILRLVIDSPDPALAALPWEAGLPGHFTKYIETIVRGSPVLPHNHNQGIPFTLPLRVLQISPFPVRKHLRESIRHIFGSTKASQIAQAFILDSCGFSSLTSWQTKSGWPTAEVLHFDHFPTLDQPHLLLSTADPQIPGTLGWLMRISDTWQVRLIVIRCQNANQLGQARRLATALLNRGGPAVLVEGCREELVPGFYQDFYWNIIHDQPLDICFPTKDYPWVCSLFVGQGRSEMLRVSKIGARLMQLETEIDFWERAEFATARRDLEALLARFQTTRPATMRDNRRALENFRMVLGQEGDNLGALVYQFHEREGLIPLSATVMNLRNSFGWVPPAQSMYTVEPPKLQEAPSPRFVNSHFWEYSKGELTRLQQNSTRLSVGETYHLGVQIGSKDEHVQVVGPVAPLFEEIFKWTPEMEGVWLEVGVTGLDFEVLGDPVQELWLPREGPSETIYFAVVPQKENIAQLRFCIFFKNDVLQSWKIVVLTQKPETPVAVPKASTPEKWKALDRPDDLVGQPPAQGGGRAGDVISKVLESWGADALKKRLAQILDIPVEEVPDQGYYPKLEYSVTANLLEASQRRERALSIVANQIDGKPVVTVKGYGIPFSISTDANLPRRVQKVRDALAQAAGAQDNYIFGTETDGNMGDGERLANALKLLAEPGWKLYQKIISQEDGALLAQQLENNPETIIHVAHILLKKAIPWAGIYDRQYDPRCRTYQGKPVGHAVCLASLPTADGKYPIKPCGQDPECLLHPDQCKKREQRGEALLIPKTVICPQHFWGFRHIIELPPQQVQGNQSQEQKTCILSEKDAIQLFAGINSEIPDGEDHDKHMKTLVETIGPQFKWHSVMANRDEVLEELAVDNLDMIYFYCHSRGGEIEGTPQVDPYLEFGKDSYIEAEDLPTDIQWTHNPLVVLNSCHSVGFDPRSLSPFIEIMTRDLKAAGVLGTEIAVNSRLAQGVAELFLRAFLGGLSAGQALLLARRTLLHKYNPLGLIYTLYASADLKLDLDGDGRCM